MTHDTVHISEREFKIVTHKHTRTAPQLKEPMHLDYPEYARRAGIEGQVWVKVLVDTLGKVEDVKVIASDNDLLTPAAVSAIKTATFLPIHEDGKIASVWVSQKIRFKLTQPE